MKDCGGQKDAERGEQAKLARKFPRNAKERSEQVKTNAMAFPEVAIGYFGPNLPTRIILRNAKGLKEKDSPCLSH